MKQAQQALDEQIITKDKLLDLALFLRRARVRAVSDYFGQEENVTEAKLIVELVCAHFGVEVETIQSRSRQQPLPHIRHICHYFLIKHASYLTLEQMGQLTNKCKHANVLHGRKYVVKQSKVDRELKRDVKEIQCDILLYFELRTDQDVVKQKSDPAGVTK